MVWSDHAIAAVLVILLPLVGHWKYRRLQRAMASGNLEARSRMYVKTALTQWTVLAVTVGHWLLRDRQVEDLGLWFESTGRFWGGLAVCLVLSALFVVQAWVIRGSESAQRQVRKSTQNLAAIAPGNDRELRMFYGLSLTAGICEEILYRGYMIWYVQQTVPWWLAIVVAAVFFGCGHAYQGVSGVAKTFAVGLVTGGLFVIMGSVWGVALLHAVVDASSGFVLRLVTRVDGAAYHNDLGAGVILVDQTLPTSENPQS